MPARSKTPQDAPSAATSDDERDDTQEAPDDLRERAEEFDRQAIEAMRERAERDDAARVVQGFVARSSPTEGFGGNGYPLGHPSNVGLAAEWDTSQREDRPLTVWEAIAEVTRQVDAIAKTGRASGSDGGYAFRGIDQVLEALHPILGEVGLVILPGSVVREEFTTRATRSGGTLNVARLLVRYTLLGPDGSREVGEAWGEAGDSGDKATQKAHSQSYKSFTLQAFSIPTQQSAEDEPDAVNESARPFTADEVRRATAAARAAEEADTAEKLAAIRRRALHLLAVPVPLEDGSVVPLSVLFDQRLSALDSAGEPR